VITDEQLRIIHPSERARDYIDRVLFRPSEPNFTSANKFLHYAAEQGIISTQVVSRAMGMGERFTTASRIYTIAPEFVEKWVVLRRIGAV